MKKLCECLAVIAILGLAGWLRFTPAYNVADLAIVPDSGQYAIAGWNLAHGKGLWIYINELKLPMQYPCGFSMVLAACYLLTGTALHSGLYVVFIFSLLTILLVYLFTRAVFGVPAALLSATFLAVAPSSVGYSQVLISDMVSNVFIVAGLWCAWAAAVRGKNSSWLWFAAGALCGFSASVHLLSGMTVVPLCVACILGTRGKGRELFRALAFVLAGLIIGLAPVLAYNAAAFGNPFTSGYYYWERWGRGEGNFSLLYAIRNTAVSERGDQRGNIVYYLWHFLGLSWPTLFAPYFFGILLLALFGAGPCGTERHGRGRVPLVCALAACTAALALLAMSGTAEIIMPWAYLICATAAMLAAFLLPRSELNGRGAAIFGVMGVSMIIAVLVALFFYSFQMSKFLLPAVPLVCILAGRGATLLLRACRGAGPRAILLRIPVAILLAVTAWGCWRPFTRGALSSRAPTWWYEGLAALDKIAPQDACLVSGIDGVYATHYFVKNTGRRYIPISREVEYIRQRDIPVFVAIEDPEQIAGLLASGKRVYMDGFTYEWWRAPRGVLEQHFNLVPVVSYYGGRLNVYEILQRRIEEPAQGKGTINSNIITPNHPL